MHHLSKPRVAVLSLAVAGALLGFGSAHAIPAIGLTSSGQLARFDTATPASATTVGITGLTAGDRLIGIDYRPSNGLLYGISLNSQIYTINEATGAASFVAALSTPFVNSTLSYGFDFNPVADAGTGASLRVISSSGNNYAVNVATGAVTVAQNIGAGFANVAYTPANAGATSLYFINSDTDSLHVATGAFNTPTITSVGLLGMDVLKVGGFDISAGSGAVTGYAALNSDDGTSLTTGLYIINLATGALTLQGTYNGTLTGLTVAAIPEPGTYLMMALGLVAVGVAKTRRLRASRD